MYFFTNGKPYRQPYRIIGNQEKFEKYEMIEKSKRGNLEVQNQSIYSLNGRNLCNIDYVKSEEAFVMVPRNHCFKPAPYAKVFNEFLRAKKACETEHVKYSCPDDKKRSKSVSSLKSEKNGKTKKKEREISKCSCGSQKYNDIFVESYKSPTRRRQPSRTRQTKTSGCCSCCGPKNKSRDGSLDSTYSKSKDNKCLQCGQKIKGLRLDTICIRSNNLAFLFPAK